MLDRLRLISVEIVWAVTVGLLGLLDLAGADVRGPLWANAAFLVACCVGFVLIARHPLLVMGALSVVVLSWQATLYGLTDQPPFVAFVALVLATYAGASRASAPRTAVVAAGTSTVLVLLHLAGAPAGNTLSVVIVVWVSWVLGTIRAHQVSTDREERAQLAVAEERARIARELHDVISHNVSVIVVQASVERRVREQKGTEPVGALATIEDAGRDTLVELRRLLGVLRKDDGPLSFSPQPGLDQLDDLVEPVRATGVDVDVAIALDRRLHGGVDLTAYRIVQEALTNVIKHAHARTVQVDIRSDDHAVTLSVVDDGRASAGSDRELGHGLVGMRERVALYGGKLSAGPREEGGYQVIATLPCNA